MKIKILVFFLFTLMAKSQKVVSVYFSKNSSDLDTRSKLKLDSLSQLKYNAIFKIYGNCDVSGNSITNETLSKKRAFSVDEYLKTRIGSHISISTSLGLGDRKQVNDNSTEELSAKNRRVDIFVERKLAKGEKIVKKSYASFFAKEVSKMSVKDTFSLPDVNFYGGRSVWLPKGQIQIQKLLKILKENPSLEVELQGHICCDYDNFDGQDFDTKTFNLSYNRANSIKDFLVKNGISANRIKSVGFGHLNPIVYPEFSEEDFSKNRRVEIVIIKK